MCVSVRVSCCSGCVLKGTIYVYVVCSCVLEDEVLTCSCFNARVFERVTCQSIPSQQPSFPPLKRTGAFAPPVGCRPQDQTQVPRRPHAPPWSAPLIWFAPLMRFAPLKGSAPLKMESERCRRPAAVRTLSPSPTIQSSVRSAYRPLRWGRTRQCARGDERASARRWWYWCCDGGGCRLCPPPRVYRERSARRDGSVRGERNLSTPPPAQSRRRPAAKRAPWPCLPSTR